MLFEKVCRNVTIRITGGRSLPAAKWASRYARSAFVLPRPIWAFTTSVSLSSKGRIAPSA